MMLYEQTWLAQAPSFQVVNGNVHESQYQYLQGGPGYRPQPGYGPPKNPPNSSQSPSLHLFAGHKVVSGHPESFPPSHYGHLPPADPHPRSVCPPDYYSQHQIWPYSTGRRRKQVRAEQACDSCRYRKAKCDEGRPGCQNCKYNNLKCSYRDLPLQEGDNRVQAMAETLRKEVEDTEIRKLFTSIAWIGTASSPLIGTPSQSLHRGSEAVDDPYPALEPPNNTSPILPPQTLNEYTSPQFSQNSSKGHPHYDVRQSETLSQYGLLHPQQVAATMAIAAASGRFNPYLMPHESAARRMSTGGRIVSTTVPSSDPPSINCPPVNKDLPINIKGVKLNAVADTGSDECCMPKWIADKLGLKVRSDTSDIKSFEKGDGSVLKSIGRTTMDCSFWNEPGRKIRCVVYVFEKLIIPLIMGRRFLESTETLTQHPDRLVNRPPRSGICRIMHLSRPKQRMRCYIDSDLVAANPDTGAEMELVSPKFVERKGYTVHAPDAEHEEVQFVDGSIARTRGQVTMTFEAYGDASQYAIPTKSHERKFYVLEGLTTDILLGQDLLYGINAFTEHASSFVDVDDLEELFEMKGIVWVDRAEERLARMFAGAGLSALEAADSNHQSRMQRFTSLIGKATGARTQLEAYQITQRELEFERDMDNRDARENARQEAADLRMERLQLHQKATAEQQEERIRQAFDEDQRQRRRQHEAALAAAVLHGPRTHVTSTRGAGGAGTAPRMRRDGSNEIFK